MDNGGELTARLFQMANIASGSRALDFGCGVGEVTFRLARHVGQNGHVTGIDINQKAIEKADERAASEGVSNVQFVCGDVAELAARGEAFDIISCRRVLMYLPDRLAIVKLLASCLRSGGQLIVQEHDNSLAHASSSLPLHTQARAWVWETVKAEGADTGMGFHLHQTLVNAGFTQIQLVAEALVETPSQPSQLGKIVEVMAPRIIAAGIATEQEIDPATVSQRLAVERAASPATTISELMFGAVARV